MPITPADNGTGAGNGDGEELYYAFENVNDSLSYLDGLVNGGSNFLLNGDFHIDQEYAFANVNSPANGKVFFCDQWQGGGQSGDGGGRITYEKQWVALGDFAKSVKMTCQTVDSSIGSADYYVPALQQIEGNFSKHMLGKNISFSIWMKASLTGTYSLIFKSSLNGSYSFCHNVSLTAGVAKHVEVDLGVLSTSYVGNVYLTSGSFTVFVAPLCGNSANQSATVDAWEAKNSWGHSSATNWLASTSNTLEIAGAQLTVGDIKRPFFHRSFILEHLLCQRYYWKGKLMGNGSGMNYGITTGSQHYYAGGVSFPSKMRAVPTMAIDTAPTYTNCTHYDLQANEYGFVHRVDPSSNNYIRAINGVYTADARLT